MGIPPPDASTPRHRLLSVAERDPAPANSGPAQTRPGISAPTAAPQPADSELDCMFSPEELERNAEDTAHSAFRAFQEVKDEVPIRLAEIERLQQWAIAAAEMHLKIQLRLEKETSEKDPSSDLSGRHETVLAAERLRRQAKETERGLAETASDKLVVAINEAKAAKRPLVRLQWEVMQGQSHTQDEMNAALDAVTRTEVKLMIAAENKVHAWRHAWAVAVVDSPDGEGDEVRACEEERDRAEAENRKLEQDGILSKPGHLILPGGAEPAVAKADPEKCTPLSPAAHRRAHDGASESEWPVRTDANA
jgi:hypothetical protein